MRQRLFILDDDEALRDDLGELLTFAGHTVNGAGDPRALTPEVLAQTDVLLLDLSLPEMDGAAVIRQFPLAMPAPEVILLSGQSEDVIQAVADAARLRGTRILGTLKKPFDPEALLQLIDRAGASPPLRHAAETHVCSLGLVRAMEQALNQGILPITFQPKVAAQTLAFAGAELLLGNTIPQIGVVPVPEMITVATRTRGLLARLTRYTFVAGLEGLKAWRARGYGGPVNINLPRDILLEPDAGATFAALARTAGVEPAAVVCELTEDAIYDSSSEALIALAQMRLAGFGLSLDDVGQRQSGLLQLARLPVTELKIDIDLLHQSRTSAKARNIFASLVELGHRLAMKVVAEGVETEEDLAFARAQGVDLLQGFLIARKMPLEALLTWLPGPTGAAPTHEAMGGAPIAPLPSTGAQSLR